MLRPVVVLLTGLTTLISIVPGLPGQLPQSKSDPKSQPKAAPEISQGFLKFRTQEIDTTLGVGYAVLITDVNGDGKPDIVVVDTHRIVWYRNPDWKRFTILEGQTKPDNVSIDAYVINGKLEGFALAAGWRPFDTKVPGTLQWLRRGKTIDDPWTAHPIPCAEPTVHRIRFVDLDGNGKQVLVVAPIVGRESTLVGRWLDGKPVRLLAYKVPADTAKGPWEPMVLDESLHIVHGMDPIPAEGRKGFNLLTASYEGVNLFAPGTGGKFLPRLLSEPQPIATRGVSEIRAGKLRGGRRFLATVEPWHGNKVVVYSPPTGSARFWDRDEIDTKLRWGHAVRCADLDGDGGEEIIVGVRDNPSDADPFKDPRGVRVYRCQDVEGKRWDSMLVDPGGVAVEDLAVGDLNGDSRPDIVAVGRATGNVRIYWNEN